MVSIFFEKFINSYEIWAIKQNEKKNEMLNKLNIYLSQGVRNHLLYRWQMKWTRCLCPLFWIVHSSRMQTNRFQVVETVFADTWTDWSQLIKRYWSRDQRTWWNAQPWAPPCRQGVQSRERRSPPQPRRAHFLKALPDMRHWLMASQQVGTSTCALQTLERPRLSLSLSLASDLNSTHPTTQTPAYQHSSTASRLSCCDFTFLFFFFVKPFNSI